MQAKLPCLQGKHADWPEALSDVASIKGWLSRDAAVLLYRLASEVREGFECGLVLRGFNDIKEGDLLEAYKIEEVKRTLE